MMTAKLLGLTLLGSASLIATAASAQTVRDGGRPFSTPMSGAEECNNATPTPACGVGDTDGTGTGKITVNVGQDRVCWEFTVANIDPPHAGHIHRGPAGRNGPIVVNFFTNAVGTPGPLSGCTTAPLTKELLKDIMQNPTDFYLNLHNTPFPGGAIRGQLEK
jgi:hypothetical protein